MKSFHIYHHVSKTTEKDLSVDVEHESQKEEWKDSLGKIYERFPVFCLPLPQKIAEPLSDVVVRRTTSRSFTSVLTIGELSSILYYSCGSKNFNEEGVHKEERMYPSAGRLFPVEVYLLVFTSIGTMSSGVYHYTSFDHTLRLIKACTFDDNKLDTLVLFSFAKNAACAVIFSCVFETVTQKYGERGYRFALLEAGGMAHALTLTATACGVHSAQMGGIVDTTVEDLLDIDGSLESVIHSVFLG